LLTPFRRAVYNAIDFFCQLIFFALPAAGHPPDPVGANPLCHLNFSLFRIGMGPVKDGDIADEADQLTLRRLRDLGGDFLFGLLTFDEFHLDQLMVRKRQIHGADQTIRQAFRTDYDQRLQMMCLGAQVFSLRSFEGFHKNPFACMMLAMETDKKDSGDESVPREEMVEVFSTYNPGDIAFVKSLLDGEGIHYYFQGENTAMLVAAGAYARLLVRADQTDSVRDILREAGFLK